VIQPVSLKNLTALLAAGALLSGCVSPFAQFTLPGQTMVARPVTSVSQLPSQREMANNLPSQVTVQPGDTLWKISRRLDVPLRDIIDANGLMPPYAIRSGQVLRVPAGRYYTVQRGDTVTNVATRFGIASADLARLNDLPPPYVILIGQQLRLPATSDVPQRQVAEDSLPLAPVRVAGITPPPASLPAASAGAVTQEELAPMAPLSPAPTTTTATAAPPARITPPPAIPADSSAGADAEPMATASVDDVAAPPMPSSRPGSAEPVSAAAAVTVAPPVEAAPPAPQKVVAPAPPAQKINPSARLDLMWPVDGRVIATFGPKEGGLRNDGINIAAPRGAAIRAAEAGVVVYAGNGLQAFGNLVLIRHANGWVTAYAHADKLLVERGAKVARGQTIATVGSSGDVDKPQVHFQVRTSDGAVDPQKYLS
jgi:murein DD-endopeptidase MepM/ murein hydrolase activator NlpD